MGKPGCFTDEEWVWLKGDYKYSPCRDCEPGYRFNMAKEGKCDLFVILPEGDLAQLVSEDVMKELMELEIPEDK